MRLMAIISCENKVTIIISLILSKTIVFTAEK